MTTCWKHSQARGTNLLVLLALADIANDDGECWPSIPHLARKCRLDQRTAQRRIRSLEELGELVVVVCGGKASYRGGVRSNRYRILVHVPDEETKDDALPGKSPRSAHRHRGTGATQTPAPVPPITPAPVPPEPSVEPTREPSLLPVVAAATPARKRDELFDAVCQVCGITPRELTRSERAATNHALKDLRSVGADPDDVLCRAQVYRRMFPTAALTPSALARRWASLNPASKQATSAVDRAFALARKAGR